MGPLRLRDLARTDRRVVAVVTLDAAEPYLNDHRPGGRALLGTVMGVEAMAAVAATACAGLTLQGIEPHENHTSLVVADRTSAEVVVTAQVLAATEVSALIDCELASHPGGAAPVVHYRACLAFGATARDAATPLRPGPLAGPATSADALYLALFHGPAFRVVAAAQWRSGEWWCRMADALPPLFAAAASATVSAPRLLEFALQSAGLYAIATEGTLRIPWRIDAVRYHRSPAAAGVAADAHVQPARDAHAPGGSLDIRVVDAMGSSLLSVSGYATTPLPFTTRVAALATLRSRLAR